MARFVDWVFFALSVIATYVTAAPAGSSDSPTSSIPQVPSSSLAASAPSDTVAPASDDPNGILWTENDNIRPEPMRGSLGSNILGPQNVPMDLQNADLFAPPSTDAGTV